MKPVSCSPSRATYQKKSAQVFCPLVMNDFTKTSINWYKNNENLFAQKTRKFSFRLSRVLKSDQ